MKPIHILLAVVCSFVWGGNMLSHTIGLNEFPPFLFAGLRCLTMLPCLFFLPLPKVSWSKVVLLAIVVGLVSVGFISIGMSLGVSAGMSAIILQTSPFFVVILSTLLLKETLQIHHIFGILIGFVGVVIAFQDISANSTIMGVICLLIAAVAWGYGIILIKQFNTKDVMPLIAWHGVIGAIPLLTLAFILDDWQDIWQTCQTASWQVYGCIIYSGMISIFICSSVWGWLIYKYPTAQVTPFLLLIPLSALFLSAIFLGEPLTLELLASALLVILGLAINQEIIRISIPLPKALRLSSKTA